jgi:hypothetical protein
MGAGGGCGVESATAIGVGVAAGVEFAIAIGVGVAAGVELTTAAGAEITRIGVPLGSGIPSDCGDTTIWIGVASGLGLGVEVLALGVEIGLKIGAADVVKVSVTADDFGTTSTLVPALFLTQSSISGSRRSRSFARACNKSAAICILVRSLSVVWFLLKVTISSAVF